MFVEKRYYYLFKFYKLFLLVDCFTFILTLKHMFDFQRKLHLFLSYRMMKFILFHQNFDLSNEARVFNNSVFINDSRLVSNNARFINHTKVANNDAIFVDDTGLLSVRNRFNHGISNSVPLASNYFKLLPQWFQLITNHI